MSSGKQSSPLAQNLTYYAQNAASFDRKTWGISLATLYQNFLPLLPKGGYILDAGCGTGRDASAFASMGFKVDAFDASPELVKLARKHGVAARVSTFRRLKAKARYHGIWACASLLHVPRVEMASVIHALTRALKRGGILYISLKSGHGEGIQDDGRFFSLFGLDEFNRVLRKERSLRIRTAWIHESPDSNGLPVKWLNYLAVKAVAGSKTADGFRNRIRRSAKKS